jgi:integrase
MSWLHRRGEIDRLPEFPEIPVDEYTPTIISGETQDLVLQAIPEDRRGGFLAAARLGLRPGEIRALDVSDYHEGWVTISKAVKGPSAHAPVRGTKTRKVRRLPVGEDLRDWIERRLASVTAQDRIRGPSPLFLNPTGRSADRRWTANALREEWNRACAQVGVRVRMYEGTKHAFASDALRRNVPKEKLQKFLGHADARSTDRYAKLADGALVDVLRPADLSLACRSPKNAPEKPSNDAQFWRGGRDSNPGSPTISTRNSDAFLP